MDICVVGRLILSDVSHDSLLWFPVFFAARVRYASFAFSDQTSFSNYSYPNVHCQTSVSIRTNQSLHFLFRHRALPILASTCGPPNFFPTSFYLVLADALCPSVLLTCNICRACLFATSFYCAFSSISFLSFTLPTFSHSSV